MSKIPKIFLAVKFLRPKNQKKTKTYYILCFLWFLANFIYNTNIFFLLVALALNFTTLLL